MSPPVHWAHIGESTFAAGMWFLYAVHRLFGRGPFRLCLYPVVLYYWAVKSKARRASMQYLQRMEAAHGLFGRPPAWRHNIRHFLSFAETLLDKLLAIGGRYRFAKVRFEGLDAVLPALAAGQGGLVVTAHVGCLELCRALADRTPALRLNVLVHTAHAERFNRMMRRLDAGSAIELIQVSDVSAATAVMLAEKVARGEFVAIAGDRVPVAASKTVMAEFLGRPAPLPVGPYVLAALLKCPLYLMGCLREAEGHVVRFELLAERVELPRARRNAALAAHAAHFTRRLEALLVRAPYEWFNFFAFWDQCPGAHPQSNP